MSGWVDIAIGLIGWDWARAVIDAGDGWRLLSWTVVFSIVFAAIGFFVGHNLGKRSLKECEKENGELRTRRDTLLEENEKLNGKIRALESENTSLKSDIEDRDTEMEKLKGELDKRRQSDLQKAPGLLAAADELAQAVKASVAPASLAPSRSVEDDPLSKLLPIEISFLLRVYDEAQVHVGMENLKVAKSLQQKGVITRTDAPESGVISQCDVELTSEWVPIMNARANELRSRAR